MPIMYKITDSELTRLAGVRSFKRGMDYFQSGSVTEWRQQDNIITGLIQGTDEYVAVLRCDLHGLDGYCDCPASEGQDFCKHCVALALQYRSEQVKPVNKASERKSLELLSEHELSAQLQILDKSHLQESLFELFQAFPNAYLQWSAKVASYENEINPDFYRQCIDGLFSSAEDLSVYSKIKHYFQQIEDKIGELLIQIKGLSPDESLELSEYILACLHEKMEMIDESGKVQTLSLKKLVYDFHIQTLAGMPWDVSSRVNYLAFLLKSKKSAYYPEIPGEYANILGDEGLSVFHDVVRSEWDKLPDLTDNKHVIHDENSIWKYSRLSQFLLQKAEEKKDINDVIQIRLKTASTALDYVQIVELCISHKIWDQAKIWLKKAASSPNRENAENEIKHALCKIFIHDKNFSKALPLQWTMFTSTVSLQDYQTLIFLEKELKQPPTLAKKANQYLRSMLSTSQEKSQNRRWANALVSILLYENDLASAQEIVEVEQVDPEFVHRLIQSLNQQPASVLPLTKRLATYYVQQTNNEDYRKAVTVLKECESSLKAQMHRIRFQSILSSMQTEFQEKRNFIKYLSEAFG